MPTKAEQKPYPHVLGETKFQIKMHPWFGSGGRGALAHRIIIARLWPAQKAPIEASPVDSVDRANDLELVAYENQFHQL